MKKTKISLAMISLCICNMSYANEYNIALYKIRLSGFENQNNNVGETLPPIDFIPNAEDLDNDGIPDTEDPDHPSTDENNYVSWVNFLNAFCGVSVSDNTSAYNQLSTGMTYCEGFSKMPDEELPNININNLQLYGNSLWNNISGISNVTNINSITINPNNTNLNIAKLSEKNYTKFYAWNIKGGLNINVKNVLWLFNSSLSNVTVGDLNFFRSSININSTYISNMSINNAVSLWDFNVGFNSYIKSINMNNYNVERLYWTTSKNNINEVSGIKAKDINIQSNGYPTLTNLDGLSSALSEERILNLYIGENNIQDFSVLGSLRIVDQSLNITSNSFDMRVLENLQVVIGNFYINSPNITQKAASESSLCKGILNGNIRIASSYYGSYEKYCN